MASSIGQPPIGAEGIDGATQIKANSVAAFALNAVAVSQEYGDCPIDNRGQIRLVSSALSAGTSYAGSTWGLSGTWICLGSISAPVYGNPASPYFYTLTFAIIKRTA